MGAKQRPHSQRQNQGLVDSIADQLIRQEQIVLELDGVKYIKLRTRDHVPQEGPDTAATINQFYDLALDLVYDKVDRLSAETLGRIASTGRQVNHEGYTALVSVHDNRPWLDKDGDGLYLLKTIVMTTIIARMWDLLNYNFNLARLNAMAADMK